MTKDWDNPQPPRYGGKCYSKILPDICQCKDVCMYAAFESHNPTVGEHRYIAAGAPMDALNALKPYLPTDTKPSNPKDGVGSRKVGLHAVPFTVLWELGNAMTEGGYKYGTHNYREAGVRASVYFDAAVARHLGAWWEGEDIDPDSGVNHVTKAIASLVVLRDSMIRGNWVDDRPIKSDPNLLAQANERAAMLADKYPDKAAPFTELRKQEAA